MYDGKTNRALREMQEKLIDSSCQQIVALTSSYYGGTCGGVICAHLPQEQISSQLSERSSLSTREVCGDLESFPSLLCVHGQSRLWMSLYSVACHGSF